jgi:glycosyltransferase involved in cell wall biosynthesis
MSNKNKDGKKQRIGIDARFFGPRQKGLGRYAQKLVEYLEKIEGGSSEREYYIFLKKENFDLYQPESDNFHKVEADFAWYSFKEQLIYPFFLKKFQLDLMHFTHFNVPLLYRKGFLVTIHDLILFHYPTVRNTTRSRLFYFVKLIAYRIVISWAVKRAIKILAVSDFTKQDVKKNLKISQEKIIRIYEGCGLEKLNLQKSLSKEKKSSKNFSRKILKKYAILEPYLLYVGNAYPHKNLERLVLAFGELRENFPELNLVLVGGEDFFYQRLQNFTEEKLGQESGVIFAGFVPDEELEFLYQAAQLYVFPSLYEGFGIPPLEALGRGLPVLSSPETSIREILGDLVTYFNPREVKDIKNKIAKFLDTRAEKTKAKLAEESQKLEEQARRLEKKFSWQNMAKETREVYGQVLPGVKTGSKKLSKKLKLSEEKAAIYKKDPKYINKNA